MDDRPLLAIDLGGTNCRFGLFSGQTPQSLKQIDTFSVISAQSQSLKGLLDSASREKLDEWLPQVRAVSMAVAGPVTDFSAKLTNLPWRLDGHELESLTGVPVFLLNDFSAHALSWVTPIRTEVKTIVPGLDRPANGPIAFIGAGTGLGKALLLPHDKPVLLPSEGGHCLFGVENAEDAAFQAFALKQQGHPPTWDDILSGRGLSLLYHWLHRKALSPEEIGGDLAATPKLHHYFSTWYGRAGREYVLDCLATGGLVICGGIAAKNPEIVESPDFLAAFVQSKAHKALLEQVPVYLLDDQQSALWGAAAYTFS